MIMFIYLTSLTTAMRTNRRSFRLRRHRRRLCRLPGHGAMWCTAHREVQCHVVVKDFIVVSGDSSTARHNSFFSGIPIHLTLFEFWHTALYHPRCGGGSPIVVSQSVCAISKCDESFPIDVFRMSIFRTVPFMRCFHVLRMGGRSNQRC